MVNTSDARDLRVIRGIGPELASRIITLRKAGVVITSPMLEAIIRENIPDDMASMIVSASAIS